jgi:hypothetical protein
MARHRFPATFSPKKIAKLIRSGILQNARFAAAVLVRGAKRGRKVDQHLEIRTDVLFPSLYQIRQQGRFATPVAFATAHVAALFVKHFPRDASGVYPPEAMPLETRRAILAGIRAHGIRVTHKTSILKRHEDEEEF